MSNYIEYTVRVYDDGFIKWYLNGLLHREGGPAVEHASGVKEWYLNNQRHREDGPARIWVGECREWWFKNQLHREDGPAIEFEDGTKAWFLNGVEYTEEEFNNKMNSCDGKEVEIEGKTYILKLKTK